ncbi:MAG: Gldg family protein [Leptolyngbyaceae cyanobacterium MO_188.B28]|nr:Gldg family protein [Leptolyngbyaceae cyanobacterium MO_188.B28]
MKTFETYRKTLKYLLWPGLALTTAGFVPIALGQATLISTSLLLGGIVLMGIGAWFAGYYSLAKFWGQRSTQAGTNALVATVAMLVILGLVNFLGVRYSARLDLTENQLFSLAPQSKEVVSQLTTPVRLVIFDANQNSIDKQLLQSYRRQNSLFSFEYIDPFAEPVLSRQYGVQTPGEVYLEVGDKRLLVQQVSGDERLAERQLTNRLEQIVSNRTLTIYFLEGHGEYKIDGSESGFFQASASLEDKNYTVKSLNLAETPETLGEASVIVVAGPQQAFFEAELNALEAYLEKGGGLLLMVDPNTDPNLDSFLETWGITLDERLVLDTSGGGRLVGLGPAAPLVTDYGDHPITRDFGDGRSFYPVARPVEVTAIPGVIATPLLFTNPQSQAEAISDSGELEFDPNETPEGPFVLGVALNREVTVAPEISAGETESNSADEAAKGEEVATEPTTEAAEPTATATDSTLDSKEAAADQTTPEQSTQPTQETSPTDTPEPSIEENPSASEEADTASSEARMVVIGNATFATDGLFEQQLNGDVFLNAVTWLGRQDDATFSIRPKEITNRRIVMTLQQQLAVGALSLLILPLLGFVGAIAMWLKRR